MLIEATGWIRRDTAKPGDWYFPAPKMVKEPV
jgi:hypothetical protein